MLQEVQVALRLRAGFRLAEFEARTGLPQTRISQRLDELAARRGAGPHLDAEDAARRGVECGGGALPARPPLGVGEVRIDGRRRGGDVTLDGDDRRLIHPQAPPRRRCRPRRR
jgi:hypothetical protein